MDAGYAATAASYLIGGIASGVLAVLVTLAYGRRNG